MIFESKGAARVSPARRTAAWLFILIMMAGLALGLDALLVEPQFLMTLSRIDLPSGHGDRLAKSLAGARVVHVTDLHVHGMGLRERRLARRLEWLEPDLLLMTGDYGETADGMDALTRMFGSVRPALGSYAALGNNDHFKGQRDEIVTALEAAGVTVLVNRSQLVQAPGGALAIVGLDDPHYGRDDISAAMEGVPEDVPVVLLAHSPDVLQRKGRGLMVNAGDEHGPWRRGWWWQDGTHVRPDPGVVVFPSTGRRRMRVQRREDGVAVDEIRLLPAGTVRGGGGGDRPARLRGFKGMPEPSRVPGEIVIKADRIREEDLHGGWKKVTKNGEIMLVDTPDEGFNQSFAQVDPASFFEAEIEAVGGLSYHVWVHLWSANAQGTSDSLYLQFTDSLNWRGDPDYRIGASMPDVDRSRVDLMLSGHTHGGQVRLPGVGALERNVKRSPYQEGLYEIGEMSLFVSRGVGWSSLPVRFWCPPEIVLFERSGEGDHAGSL